MRSIPFVLLLLVLALETEAQKKNVVKTTLWSLLGGQYRLAYERVVFPNLSFQISAGIIVLKQPESERNPPTGGGKSYNIELGNQNGFILIPEVRYYFKGQAPEKIFIGGFARFRQKNTQYEDTSDVINGTQGIDQNLSYVLRRNVSGMGVHLGYQWISKSGLSLEIFAGPAYKSITFENIYDKEALNKASTHPRYEKEGDELIDQKLSGRKLEKDKYGLSPHAGFHISYAF